MNQTVDTYPLTTRLFAITTQGATQRMLLHNEMKLQQFTYECRLSRVFVLIHVSR